MYDIRDSKPYTVRKLADGNCWMVDSLAFELEPNKTYTGVVNATGAEMTFNTGSSCGNDGACIMNGNTGYGSKYDNWYYSWYAATAGSGTSGSTNSIMPNSICPAKWKLPAPYTYDTAQSFGSISRAYGMPTSQTTGTNYMPILEAFPLSFKHDGNLRAGALRDTGWGVYQTNSSYTITSSNYCPHYGPDFFYPIGSCHKYDGLSVRCVVV